jgi:hypothetical protein
MLLDQIYCDVCSGCHLPFIALRTRPFGFLALVSCGSRSPKTFVQGAKWAIVTAHRLEAMEVLLSIRRAMSDLDVVREGSDPL